MSVQVCVTFPFGSLVWLAASFTRPPTQVEIDAGTALDADDWQPIDPDTVLAKVKTPAGVESIYGYLSSPPDIVRDDVGEYHLPIIANEAGEWFFRFESTGAGQAANEHNFKVAVTAF